MGNRTTLHLEIVASDLDRVIHVFEGPAYTEPSLCGPGIVVLTFEEVNYGGAEQLLELAQSGLTFRGRHAEGYDYCGTTFASCNRVLAAIPSPHGDLMIRIHATTLEPDPKDLDAARRWRDTDDQVRAYFAASASPALT